MRDIADETDEVKQASKMWNHRRFPPGAKCERCGSTSVYPLPTLSVGSGAGFKPVADDFYCGHCGTIAPARW